SREPERALDHERGGKSLKLLSGSYDFKAVYLAPNSPLEQRKVLWRRDVKVLSNAKTVVEFQFAPPGLPAPTPTSKPAKTGTLPTPKTPAPSKKMPEK
ncbi:MAG: hypothetical protein KC609_10560, partial [Myxococcales bacterium]|nr:hypothetical protein [Myxococcales bacterium]